MTSTTDRIEQRPEISFVLHGDVETTSIEYATKRLETVLDQIGAPVLFVQAKLTQAADPARERPARARATIDVNGDLVRGQVRATTMTEAIDLLADRLRDQLQHRSERRRARRQRGGRADTAAPPTNHDRAPDEREIVRQKTFAIVPADVDEAIADLVELDYDFFLFLDAETGSDALIERADDGYRLTRTREPEPAAALPPGVAVTNHAVPTATVQEIAIRLGDGGEPFVFFVDAATQRGSVLYRRDDGDYGLLTRE